MHVFAKGLLLGVFFWGYASAIIFRDKTSSIELRTSSSIYQTPDSTNIITGKLLFGPRTSEEEFDEGKIYPGSSPLYFRGGIYSENGNDLVVTGTLSRVDEFSSAKTISLSGESTTQSRFDANITDAVVRLAGADNIIAGRPKFRTANAVRLVNDETSLTLATDGDFTTTIVLNGGRILLKNDLQLGEEIVFTGSGSVSLQGNNIIFGTTETTWTSSIDWIHANNINLAGNMRLAGTWAFDGDATVIGNNNILDLTTWGQVRVKANSNVELNNLTLQGLGSGSLWLDDETSQLTLKNCVITLDQDYTVSAGHWVVASPSTVIVGEHYLNFLEGSMLSVADGASLSYDPLEFNDKNNIVFLDETPVKDAGTISIVRTLPLGPYRYTTDVLLDSDTVVTVLRKLQIINSVVKQPVLVRAPMKGGAPPPHEDPPPEEPEPESEAALVINGDQFSYLFARKPKSSIFTIDDDMKVVFTNISLKNFPVASDSISLGSGAKIVFDDKTTVELGDSATLTTTWQCVGQTVVYGNGKVLSLGSNGNIVLSPGASILFDNITLDGVHGYNIKCMDNRCTITFGNVLWQQDGNYSFTKGKLYVRDRLDLLGSTTFNYATSQTSTVASQAGLVVNKGMTFKYNPPLAKKNLLQFEDAKAFMKLDGATLAVTTTGMVLTHGSLRVANASVLKNQGALSNSQGVVFGDGNTAHDLTLDLAPGAILDVQSGILLFNQA